LPQVFRRPLIAGALLLIAALGTAPLVMTGPQPGAIDLAVGETDLADPSRIERGRYLALAGNCASCHTAPEGGFMAGGLAFETEFGTLYSTNITPDAETGIGSWNPEDFLISMRYGIRPSGEHLYPAFPYTAFSKLTDDDILDLYAYIRSLPPVRRENRTNALGFPYNQRALLGPWKSLFFKPGVFTADSEKSAQWNRGAYLVDALAHCAECHSPRNRLGAKIDDALLAGGSYPDRVPDGHTVPWSAPNLTGAANALGMWPQAALEEYLKTGRNEFVETFGPMT